MMAKLLLENVRLLSRSMRGAGLERECARARHIRKKKERIIMLMPCLAEECVRASCERRGSKAVLGSISSLVRGAKKKYSLFSEAINWAMPKSCMRLNYTLS